MPTPAFAKAYSQDKLFHIFLKTLGCRNVEELKQKIVPCDGGAPNTDGSSIDYHICVDVDNEVAYFHTTSDTYTKMQA